MNWNRSFLCVLACLPLVACGGSGSPGSGGAGGTGNTDGHVEIALGAQGVTPRMSKGRAGQAIVFTNRDTQDHQVAADAPSTCPELQGPVLKAGESFTATLELNDKTRRCSFHDALRAQDATFQGEVDVDGVTR